MNFTVVTFGCQMNKHDSERISGLLKSNGNVETLNEDADLIIFNTCSVRENADNRLIGHLGLIKARKRENPSLKIAVGGCFAQSEGAHLLETFPQVDLVFGTQNIDELPELLDKIRYDGAKICSLKEKADAFISDLPPDRKNHFKGWVTITEGCDNFCSYCIVPFVRGRERSRPFASIVNEIERLVLDGVTEVTLLGQNVNSYRYGSGKGFAELLKSVNKVEGLERIRFATSHPKDFSEEIIDAIAASEKVCEHIHLPVQAGSNAVLSAMNRGYNRDSYINLVEKIRNCVGGVSISTDIIVGFPGERREDFDATLELVKQIKFDSAFTFIYSSRKGTAAAALKDITEQVEKSSRFTELVKLQESINLNNNLRFVGSTREVLVDGVSKKAGTICGRTRDNRVINFEADEELVGKIVSVEVVSAGNNSLSGRLK